MEKFETEEYIQKAIDQFWEMFPSVWNIVRSHLRAIAAEQFDISVEQIHLLRHIRKGLTTVSEIAEARSTSRPAVSQAAESLVEKGLITRHHKAADRRFVQLALTQSGEELLNEIFRQNRAWMMDRMASLNVEELEQITTAFALLKSAFDLSAEKSAESPNTGNG